MFILDLILDALGWLIDRLPARQGVGPGLGRAQRLAILLAIFAVVASIVLLASR
jgi:hypothetical protein